MPLSPDHKRQRGLGPLLRHAPKVYVGPGAEGALRGERFVLLGARRPQWVDVLELGPPGDASLSSLVDSRFQSFGLVGSGRGELAGKRRGEAQSTASQRARAGRRAAFERNASGSHGRSMGARLTRLRARRALETSESYFSSTRLPMSMKSQLSLIRAVALRRCTVRMASSPSTLRGALG